MDARRRSNSSFILIHLLGTEQISPDQEPENFKKLDLLFGKAIVFLRHNISSADLNQKSGVSRLDRLLLCRILLQSLSHKEVL